MNRCLIICLVSFFSVVKANAQTPDELIPQIKKSPLDTTQIDLLVRLGNYYLYKPGEYKNDLDSAYECYARALQLSKSLKDINWENKTLVAIAICDREAENYDHAIDCYMHVIAYYQKMKLPAEEANTWLDLGDLLPANNEKNIERKIVFFKNADSIYKNHNLRLEQAHALKAIGDAHLNEGKLDLAETELLSVVDQYKKEGYKKMYYAYDLLGEVARLKGEWQKKLYYELEVVKSVAVSPDSVYADYFFYKLAATYNDLNRYKESIGWSGKALSMAYDKHNSGQLYLYGKLHISNLIALNQASAALVLLNKIVKKTPPATEDEKISVFQSYGEIYDALKDYGKAKQSYTNMIDVIENNDKDRGIVNQLTIINNHIVDYLTVVRFFISVKDYNKADNYLRKIAVFSDSLESPLLKKEINLYGFVLDSVSGNYISAIKHYQQYKKIEDSMFSAAKSKQIAETDIKYQTAQRLSAIERLKNREEAQKAELQEVTLQKNITFGGIAAFMILAGLAYNGYRNKYKSNKLLHGKQAEINRQNSDLQQLLYEKDELLTEKDWLLQEVHHRVKNNLQIVMSLLSTQSAFLENKAALDAINQSRDRVNAISLIHQKLYGEKSVSKIDLPSYVADLVQYLKDSFNVFERKIIISYSVQEIGIDIAQIVPLGLILNEAITNAIKYAFDSNGGRLAVELKMVNDSSAMLTVADNGKGFPDEFNPKAVSTLGMQMMVALSKQLNGTLIAQNDDGAVVIVNFQLESFRKVTERPNHVKLDQP